MNKGLPWGAKNIAAEKKSGDPELGARTEQGKEWIFWGIGSSTMRPGDPTAESARMNGATCTDRKKPELGGSRPEMKTQRR